MLTLARPHKNAHTHTYHKSPPPPPKKTKQKNDKRDPRTVAACMEHMCGSALCAHRDDNESWIFISSLHSSGGPAVSLPHLLFLLYTSIFLVAEEEGKTEALGREGGGDEGEKASKESE